MLSKEHDSLQCKRPSFYFYTKISFHKTYLAMSIIARVNRNSNISIPKYRSFKHIFAYTHLATSFSHLNFKLLSVLGFTF